MKTQTIWLSGSRGFIGKYLKKKLLNSNHNLVCISNQKNNFEDDVQFINFSSRKSIREFVDKNGCPDIFFHLGWGNVYDPHSVLQQENYIEGVNLIDVLFESGTKKIIHTGSSSEYSGFEGKLSEDLKIINYENNYIKEKLNLCNYGIGKSKEVDKIFINVRVFYAYGSGQRSSSLINLLYDSFLKQLNVNLTAGEHFRDYIYVSDVADGLISIMKINSSEIINLGSGEVIKVKDYILKFWEILGGDRKLLSFGAIKSIPSQPTQPWSFADMDKLTKLTNWHPSIDLTSGINKTIFNLKNNIKE